MHFCGSAQKVTACLFSCCINKAASHFAAQKGVSVPEQIGGQLKNICIDGQVWFYVCHTSLWQAHSQLRTQSMLNPMQVTVT